MSFSQVYPGLSTVPCAFLLFTVDLRDLAFSWTFLSLAFFFSLSFFLVFLFVYIITWGVFIFLRDRLIYSLDGMQF